MSLRQRKLDELASFSCSRERCALIETKLLKSLRDEDCLIKQLDHAYFSQMVIPSFSLCLWLNDFPWKLSKLIFCSPNVLTEQMIRLYNATLLKLRGSVAALIQGLSPCLVYHWTSDTSEYADIHKTVTAFSTTLLELWWTGDLSNSLLCYGLVATKI